MLGQKHKNTNISVRKDTENNQRIKRCVPNMAKTYATG